MAKKMTAEDKNGMIAANVNSFTKKKPAEECEKSGDNCSTKSRREKAHQAGMEKGGRTMTREEAHTILMKYMEGENYILHSYAVEAIMRGLAKRLDPDSVEKWGIAGLLHDLDEEQCDWRNDMKVHGPTSVEILKKEGVEDQELFDAICAHNPKCGVKAKTPIQYALLAADPMSGFVKAVAQIYPDKKIASVKPKSVLKRFNEMRFAAGANRDYMEAIEFTGLRLEDLVDVALEEMGAISDTLGL
ncbi:HD domain-containing protein [Suipraeoptans intestinalis]